MQTMNLNYSLPSSLLQQLTDINKNALIKNIIEAENKFDPKYKTELCKKFQSTGHCPYGYKCRFAHGKQELITKQQGKNYKKGHVNLFSKKGIALMDQDVIFNIMKKVLMKLIFHFIIFNYFY